MTLAVESLSYDALKALAPQWDALDRAQPLKLPFTSPTWLLPWWKHFAQSRALLRDGLRAYAFRDGSTLVGLATLVITHRPRGPLAMRQLQPLGADPNVTELNPVLALPGHDEAVHEALQDALSRDGGWDFARWWVQSGSGAEAVLKRAPDVEWRGEKPVFLLEPGPSWEAFKSSRPRNIKESLRKCYNSLTRDGHAFTFHVRTQASQMPLALDRFFALHAERAKATDTITHGDVFGSLRAQGFIREVMNRFAQQGRARVYELEIGSEVVASRMGFALDDTLYLYFSGYRSDWSRYSVMTTLTTEALKHAISEGKQTVNLSFGRDQSKTRWDPKELGFVGAHQPSSSLRSRLGHLALDLLKDAGAADTLKALRQSKLAALLMRD
jgi:CelD/BcsL family acetyltransferase involved in cellulose biosynthesis